MICLITKHRREAIKQEQFNDKADLLLLCFGSLVWGGVCMELLIQLTN